MTIRRVDSTKIFDGDVGKKEIRAGDKVSILPAERRVQLGLDENDYWAKESVEDMKQFLGVEGPFEIAWIGRWPCGRCMLYFKTDDGEPGALASNFMFAH